LAVEVRDLPAAKPHDFSGNIGALRLTASASQTKMPAGTPFTLSVRLEGQGYLPRSGSLRLETQPEFTQRFRVMPNADRALSDTLREVTYTLRPLHVEVKEVPPISVIYYDTKATQFQTVKSPAIALEVTGAVAIADENSTKTAASGENQEQLSQLEDLAAAHNRGWFTRNLIPAAALAIALGLVAAVLLRGRVRRWQARRSEKSANWRQRQATEAVHRSPTRQIQSAQDVRELLQNALRKWLHLPPGEITSQDASEKLRQAGVDRALADECAEILDACAAAEFGPGIESKLLSELTSRTQKVIGQISKVSRLSGAMT
jgi:hypothetical protein